MKSLKPSSISKILQEIAKKICKKITKVCSLSQPNWAIKAQIKKNKREKIALLIQEAVQY